MKTARFLLLGALLAGSSAVLTAGQGYQYWAAKPATSTAPAITASAAPTCTTCACGMKSH